MSEARKERGRRPGRLLPPWGRMDITRYRPDAALPGGDTIKNETATDAEAFFFFFFKTSVLAAGEISAGKLET